jgi:hypothetical protein
MTTMVSRLGSASEKIERQTELSRNSASYLLCFVSMGRLLF